MCSHMKPLRFLWMALISLSMTSMVFAAPAPEMAEGEAAELAEPIPFAELPYSARMELGEPLLNIWEFLDDGGEPLEGRRQLLGYLRSEGGRQVMASKYLDNSYMYHVLLGKAGSLIGVVDRMDTRNNKGLHWFVHGLLRIYENKSAQASGNFAKGIFSSLQLGPEDYRRLEDNGIKVNYYPSMSSYSNAAFIAGSFTKMSYSDQQELLNVSLARKVLNMDVDRSQLKNPQSQSYQLLGLYYNLGAFLVLESYNDLFAVEEFYDQPDDLYNILRDMFEFEARDVLKGRYGE